jgi:hypothetical protein
VKVERYAVEAVIAELRKIAPKAKIVEQARNNPGFDILVMDDDVLRYIEVKGTTRPAPQFIMSQGEMEFSVRHESHYSLMIVYGIDLAKETHSLHRHDGAVSKIRFGIRPLQWVCEAVL